VLMPDTWITHIGLVAGGATALGIVAHAVNTFPTPNNPYGAWLLGVIQFAVGQRIASRNTFNGMQTGTFAVDTRPESVDGSPTKV